MKGVREEREEREMKGTKERTEKDIRKECEMKEGEKKERVCCGDQTVAHASLARSESFLTSARTGAGSATRDLKLAAAPQRNGAPELVENGLLDMDAAQWQPIQLPETNWPDAQTRERLLSGSKQFTIIHITNVECDFLVNNGGIFQAAGRSFPMMEERKRREGDEAMAAGAKCEQSGWFKSSDVSAKDHNNRIYNATTLLYYPSMG